jgi:branched-chain amino acid transport system permease protein
MSWRFDYRQVAGVAVALAFVTLPFVAASIGGTYLITFTSRIIIYAIVAVSLELIVGRGGLVSFGHAAYFGLGGYVVAMASYHLAQDIPLLGWQGSNEALIVWPLAMIVSGLAAAVFGALSLRTSGVYFIMITLAFAQMVFFVFVALKFYGGTDGLPMNARNLFAGARIVDARIFYWICLAVLALVAALAWRLANSRFGFVLRGAAASERRMLALGFPVYRYRLTAFVISGMVAGLAGALWANLHRFASPDMMSWTRSGEFLVMAVLGGLSSVFGPIIGAAAFLIAESVLAGWTEQWEVIFGPLIILVALFAPRGIWGSLRGGAR